MEKEAQYIYSPLRTERPVSRRRRCLHSFKIILQLPKLFGNYIFWSFTFDNSGRESGAYKKLFKLNLYAAIFTILGGICLYELTNDQMAQAMTRSAVFPLYFPHAIGLALACKYQGSVMIGNFLGYYFSRIYLVVRGPPYLNVSRAFILTMVAVLGVLETHIGAWLMHHYLCRGGAVRKRVPTIDNVAQAFLYILITFGTTLVFDSLIAVVACLSGIVSWDNFLRFWATWWLGVVAGMLTLSPAIIHLLDIRIPSSLMKPPNYFNLVKSIVLWAVLLGLLVLVFFFSIQSFVRPLPYLVFPLIMFASFRFNRVGWAIVVAVISLSCAWGTLHRNSSLYYMAGAPPDLSSPSLILQIELFVSVMGLVGIVLAAAVKEKIQLTNDLNKVNNDLEETVAMRTNELVKANNELLISQKKAEHASHAKSDFLANMSHEIRTPIHGILGLTALLLESQLTADQRESLMSVKECADLLLHIINSVLDLSKIEAGRLDVETVPFSIRKMVSSTLRMMQARAQAHNLQLLWHIESTVPDSVVGDPGKLQQCLLNLVGNALKFTNEGSVTVRVSISVRKAFHDSMSTSEGDDPQTVALSSAKVRPVEVPPLFPRPTKPPSRLAKLRSWASWLGPYFKSDSGKSQSCTIDVHELPDSDIYHDIQPTKVAPAPGTEICSQPSTPETVDVEFEVQDTGIGISKEKLQDMFNPFTQADASTSRLYGGTGLGLCIVQRFVELLGGTIWAESEVNKGSTFVFRVPFRISSEENLTYKTEIRRGPGPMRFSSLDAPIAHKPVPKLGLKRRAYSLDVLMRNMKFIMPSLVEEDDCEESVSSKGSGGLIAGDTKGSSRITEKAVEILTPDDETKVTKPSNESSTLSPENHPTRPLTLLPNDPETTGSSLVSSDVGDSKVNILTINCTPSEHKSYPSHESLPLSGPEGSLHELKKCCVRSNSSEEVHQLPPILTSSIDECRIDGSAVDKMSTVVNVDDKTEETTGEQCAKDVTVEVTRVNRSKLEQPDMNSPAELLQETDVRAPTKLRLSTSTIRSDSANGFRNFIFEDVERPLHILLAEDNPINQKVASRQLQRHGHKVTIVNDGKLALEAVQANHELFDLVLMDVQMPNMDGLQATEMIRDLETKGNWRRLPILGLTAHAIQGYKETCLSHGMDGYLGKPFEIKQLLKQMRELLST